MELTLSELIDRLITASIRCWMAQDKIMDESLSQEERLKAAETAQKANAERSLLMQEIDGTAKYNKSYDKSKSISPPHKCNSPTCTDGTRLHSWGWPMEPSWKVGS